MKIVRYLTLLLFVMIVFCDCRKPKKGVYNASFTIKSTTEYNFISQITFIKHKRNSYYLNTEQRGILNLNEDRRVDGWLITNRQVPSWSPLNQKVVLDTFKLTGAWYIIGDQYQIKGKLTTRYIYYDQTQTIITSYSPVEGTYEFNSK